MNITIVSKRISIHFLLLYPDDHQFSDSLHHQYPSTIHEILKIILIINGTIWKDISQNSLKVSNKSLIIQNIPYNGMNIIAIL